MSETVKTPDWLIEQQRVSFFLAPGTTVDVEAAWRHVAQAEPENFSKHGALGVTSANGSWSGGRLIVQAAHARVDAIFAVSEPGADSVSKNRYLGSFSDAETVFLQRIKQWIPADIACTRLAFGCNLVLPGASIRETYENIAKLLPTVRLDVESSRDFIYQINRPTKSTVVDGLALNRLTKWSNRKIMFGAFSLNSDKFEAFPVAEEFETFLELDFNTAADYSELLPLKAVSLLIDELVALSLVAREGDKL